MRGSGRIKKTLGSIRRWFKPGAVILMYHRVTDLAADTYNLAVSPAHFAEQMEIVRRTCVPMHLVDLIDAVVAGRVPNRAVAVTFDDGYRDNFDEAYPLLQAAGVPATVFVISEKIDSPREFWWDDLERMLLAPKQVPTELRLGLNAQEYCWPTGTPEERVATHQAVHALLSVQAIKKREETLDELVVWSGVGYAGRPAYRAMTTDELIRLTDSGLVQIGGHTVNHPVLSALSVEDQGHEISEGCRRLEAILGQSIRTFAYPYGRAADWTDATATIARDAGLRGAVTTIPGSIETGADPFRLRRWAVANWDGHQFARALESFFVL